MLARAEVVRAPDRDHQTREGQSLGQGEGRDGFGASLKHDSSRRRGHRRSLTAVTDSMTPRFESLADRIEEGRRGCRARGAWCIRDDLPEGLVGIGRGSGWIDEFAYRNRQVRLCSEGSRWTCDPRNQEAKPGLRFISPKPFEGAGIPEIRVRTLRAQPPGE